MRKITMKRRGTNNKQVSGIQTPSLEQPDAGTAVVKKTREQLISERSMTVCQATGTRSFDVGFQILNQVANALVWPRLEDGSDYLNKAIAFVREMAPQNAPEAMLAVQMIAANEAALMFIHRSTTDDQTNEAIDANVLRATRLMRLYIQQLEAMQKLKGKAIQQQFTVDQVHVHQGGQAIVGSVSTSQEGR
jgi:hypothetical protein